MLSHVTHGLTRCAVVELKTIVISLVVPVPKPIVMALVVLNIHVTTTSNYPKITPQYVFSTISITLGNIQVII